MLSESFLRCKPQTAITLACFFNVCLYKLLPMSPLENKVSDVVLACVNAINGEDFERARKYVNDDFVFEGVLGSRNGADAYFDDMKNMKLKYDVKKVFAEASDVCLWYSLDISGKTIEGCGWYHLEENKITSLKVLFDPRPLLGKDKENEADPFA